jgi:hypothetical protein
MEDNIHEKTFGVNRLLKWAKELTNQSYLVNLRKIFAIVLSWSYSASPNQPGVNV